MPSLVLPTITGRKPHRNASGLCLAFILVVASPLSAQPPDHSGSAEPSPPVQGQGERQANGGQQPTSQPSVPVRIIEDPIEAERTRQREERAEKREADDLIAQQRAATAAERAADASESQSDAAWFQTALAFVGTTALFYTLWLTRQSVKLARQSAEAAIKSVQAAERSVAESVKTLAHAQEVAARDLRPWLTLSARLTEGIDCNSLDPESKRFRIFVEIKLTNVGKIAAKNVTYSINGIDVGWRNKNQQYLNALIDKVTENCHLLRTTENAPPTPSEMYCDVLAPSETHVCRLSCTIFSPKAGSAWEYVPEPVFRLKVALAVAYSSAGASDDIFIVGKVFPIGKDNLIQFLDILGQDDMRLDSKNVILGPTDYAKIS